MINAISNGGNVSMVLNGDSEQLAEEIYEIIEAFTVKEHEEGHGGKFTEHDKLVSVAAMLTALLKRFAEKNDLKAVSAECMRLLVAAAADISRKYGE